MIKNLECGLSCLLASMFFGSMLYSMLYYDKNTVFINFNSTLDEYQKQVYREIMRERMRIYIQGLLFGLLCGFIYLQYTTKSIYTACVFTVIVLGINNLYYILIPKTKYMLQYLNNQEQTNAWLDVYKSMKHRCYMGMVLGAVSYLLIGYNYN